MPENLNNKVNITLSEPSLIAQAEASVREWGPIQFPQVERLEDGRLHASYHIHSDSVHAYGQELGHAVSEDDGITWREARGADCPGGLPLPNGDYLRIQKKKPVPIDRVPEVKMIGSRDSYGLIREVYRLSDFPEAFHHWSFQRRRGGEKEWREEKAVMNDPDEIRVMTEGVYVHPFPVRLRLDPSGKLWSIVYQYRPAAHGGDCYFAAIFYRSTDHGRTWSTHSYIPYQPDRSADPHAERRLGFGEPDLAFLQGGRVLAALRTTDGHGIGPLYTALSEDGGETWSTPRVLDDLGVLPVLTRLGNGVVTACYGRPGLYLRATLESDLEPWDERHEIVPARSEKENGDTCSYTDTLILDDQSLLLVYTDFHVPGPDDTPRKTVLSRKLTFTPA